MTKRIYLVRTNRSGKVIRSQTVYATKSRSGWTIKEENEGWEIQPDKLYHPLSSYFENPGLLSYIQAKVKISFWKLKYRLTFGHLATDGYGVYMDNERYYFQFRKEDYKKAVTHVQETKNNENVKIVIPEK